MSKSCLWSARAMNKSHSLDKELRNVPPPADVGFPLTERLGGLVLGSRRYVALLVRTMYTLFGAIYSRNKQVSIACILPLSISPHLLFSIACARHAFDNATTAINAVW